jgi:hypothetical protein
MLDDRILKGFLVSPVYVSGLVLKVFNLVTLKIFFLKDPCSLSLLLGDSFLLFCTVIVQIFMISFRYGS